MAKARDPTLDVYTQVIVHDGQVITAPATVEVDATLVREDGKLDDLINRIGVRRIAEAKHMLKRRSRNR